MKHFADYWKQYPDYIPSLADILGVDSSKFENTVGRFENFTEQAMRVKKECTVSRFGANGKDIYYMDGAKKPRKELL